MSIFPLPAPSRLKWQQNKMGRVSQQWDSISTLNWVDEAVSVKWPKLTCGRILEKY